jgi:glycosyltransferase involved in cell wall biosynthesis
MRLTRSAAASVAVRWRTCSKQTSAPMARQAEISTPQRLRILFLANRIPFPIRDGQARRTYHILRGLAETHEVHLLSLYESPQEAEPETVRHLQGFCERVEMLPAPSKNLSLAMGARLLRSLVSTHPYTIWRHYSAEYATRVRAQLEATPFDVVHCDILPMAYAIRKGDAPFCALTDHDVSYLKAERLASQRRNPAARLFIQYEALKLKRLERRIFRHADLVITVSDLDREILAGLCPGCRFAVVENGVDVSAFVPDPAAVEPNVLVWVGGFHHYANYEAMRFFLEDIYPGIKRAHEQVRLYIVGPGVPDRLTRLISGDASITVTGYVEDPVPYIQRAAVFIAPILSGGGTKLKVLEAMAAGKAIVSTSLGVEGIEGRDTEHYLVADRPELFSQRVVELLGDGDLRQRLGANARKVAEEKYDWRIICEKMNRLYTDASSDGASHLGHHERNSPRLSGKR